MARQGIKLLTLTLSSLLILAACSSKNDDIPYESDTIHTNSVAAANANIQLGMRYLNRQQPDRAKAKFIRAVKDAPKLPASWYAFGYFNEVTGHIAKADKCYQYAVRLAPQDGDAHNNYGTFLCRHGKYQASVKQFIQAAKDPGYLTVGAAYENAGICSAKAGKPLAAQGYFKQAILNSPKQAASYLELAKLFYAQKKVTEAYKYYADYTRLSKTPITRFFNDMAQKPAQRRIPTKIAKKKHHTVTHQAMLPSPRNTQLAKLAHSSKQKLKNSSFLESMLQETE